MDDTYIIRLARAEDVPFLPAIELAAAEKFPPGSIPDWLRSDGMPVDKLAEACKAGNLWVAIDQKENEPVGFALLGTVGNDGLLQEIDVHPKHGRKGLGTRLIGRVVAEAKQRGFASLHLTTFTHIAWNQPYYESLGFVALSPGEAPDEIQRILAHEAEMGMENRVAMRLPLQ